MKVFVSYSINDSEQYVLTLLAQRLKEQGAYIDSSYSEFDKVLDFNTFSKITKSLLFIGIITETGDENERVLKEWDFANSKSIPSILLVDEEIELNHIDNNDNVIYFNRNNPEEAVAVVKDKTDNNKRTPAATDSNSSNSAAWVLGGLAVLAIIYLLSKSNKK